jgi:hypothetical protein
VEFEITFQDGAGPADVEMALAGVPTAEGFRLLNGRLTADPRFRAGLRMLSAVAIIAPNEETFSAVREYRAHLGGSKSNRHLFGSRFEAVAWLEDRST